MKRIESIDIVRGIVMVIMALDHTRDLIHVSALSQNPTDLATTTPILFFTRWVTHICAPTFVFLSGVSAYLGLQKMGISATKKFLLSRGIWLIFLEFTVINFGLWWDIHFNFWLFNVIATIGFGFIVLAFLLKISPKTLGIVGTVILAGQQLVGFLSGANNSVLSQILGPFFGPTSFPIGSGRTFIMGYPPIPWLAVMLLGFAVGPIFLREITIRKKQFLKIGLGLIVGFVLLRFINIYGDPAIWSVQKNAIFTGLSFINLSKYPPSLLYTTLFLGITFLLLYLVENSRNWFTNITLVFGKVPLYYFIIHWYIIHSILFIVLYSQGFSTEDFVFGFNFGRPKTGGGLELYGVYLVWLAVVALMYPLCKWFANYKYKNPEKLWLRYL